MVKELPRVLTIYDVDMPVKTARSAIAYHFRKHSSLEDGRSYKYSMLAHFHHFSNYIYIAYKE